MPLQRFTMGRMSGLAKVVHGTIAMLRFPGVVRGTTTPLALCQPRRVTSPISHSSEQGTLLTPKTQSLADSSMMNHKP
jgi:hypothetical protein